MDKKIQQKMTKKESNTERILYVNTSPHAATPRKDP
jgi:hypothetical protein